MKYLAVKNWHQFQHYKDRNPPWIKLHFEILNSEDWVMLADASKALMIACMLIASRKNGKIPYNIDYIARVTHLKNVNLKPLIDIGFLTVLADASICERMQAEFRPETETEIETETETDPPIVPQRGKRNGHEKLAGFERWYAEYPRKVAKPAALKAWNKHNFSPESVDDLIAVLKKQKRRWTDPQFIPYPATYLNQCRWQDPPVKILGDHYHEEASDESLPF